MLIGDVTPEVVKRWGRIETEEDDGEIRDLIMPAALAHISDYTGLSVEELDQREALSMPYVALCVFLYDNRSMNIINDKENAVVQSFLDGHRVNLL